MGIFARYQCRTYICGVRGNHSFCASDKREVRRCGQPIDGLTKCRRSRTRLGWSAATGWQSMDKKAMTEARPAAGDLAQLERLIAALRPKLHRYRARISGSVIDGEDVMQEALIQAVEAFPREASIAHAQAWLFRIADGDAKGVTRLDRGPLVLARTKYRARLMTVPGIGSIAATALGA